MALFDDRRFLLSHINHSFITGDDTGICEVVMLDGDVFENQHQRCLKLEGQSEENPEDQLDPEAYDLKYESELFESEQGQSYDIASDLDYICHRRRSNTAQRLHKLTKERANQSKTLTIVWKCSSPTGSQSDDKSSEDSPTSLSESNERLAENGTTDNNSTTIQKRPKSPPKKSGLTKLLEKFPSLPKNPFDEYAQYDGGMSENTLPVKKINIFIAINQQQSQPLATTTTTANAQLQQHPQQQSQPPSKPKSNEPLEVVIVSNAKVQDLIGLICWQYTNEGREPKLHHDINRYCLRIAEDNGEVDPDFTSLNSREPLSKFNFPSLALTEKTEERVRSYNERYVNGNTYTHRQPSIGPNRITSSTKVSTASNKFVALTKIFFKDAKLDANQ